MDPEATTPDTWTAVRRPRPSRRTSRLAVGAVAALTCGLLSGGVAYAHSSGGSEGGDAAAEEPAHRPHGARGTVAAIDGTTFVLTQKDGTGVSVTTSDATTFSVTTAATVADATVGSYVVVHGKRADDGTATARSILIKPAPAASSSGDALVVAWRWWHGLAGEVTANDPATGALTISTPNGVVTVVTSTDTKVIETTPATIADLTVGARVGVHGPFADDGTLSADRVKVLPAALTQPEPVPVESTTTTSTTVVVDPAVTTTTTEAPSPTTTPTAPLSADDVAVRGLVASVDGATFTITARDGSTVVVATDATTRFVVKDCDGEWNKRDDASSDDGDSADDQAASIADVVVGAQVKVVGTAVPEGTVLAAAVLIGDDDGRRSGGDQDDGDKHDEDDGDQDDDNGGDQRREGSGRRGGDDDGGSDRRGDGSRDDD